MRWALILESLALGKPRLLGKGFYGCIFVLSS